MNISPLITGRRKEAGVPVTQVHVEAEWEIRDVKVSVMSV